MWLVKKILIDAQILYRYQSKMVSNMLHTTSFTESNQKVCHHSTFVAKDKSLDPDTIPIVFADNDVHHFISKGK